MKTLLIIIAIISISTLSCAEVIVIENHEPQHGPHFRHSELERKHVRMHNHHNNFHQRMHQSNERIIVEPTRVVKVIHYRKPLPVNRHMNPHSYHNRY